MRDLTYEILLFLRNALPLKAMHHFRWVPAKQSATRRNGLPTPRFSQMVNALYFAMRCPADYVFDGTDMTLSLEIGRFCQISTQQSRKCINLSSSSSVHVWVCNRRRRRLATNIKCNTLRKSSLDWTKSASKCIQGSRERNEALKEVPGRQILPNLWDGVWVRFISYPEEEEGESSHYGDSRLWTSAHTRC